MNKQILIGKIRTSGKGFGYFRSPELNDYVEVLPKDLNTALDLDEVEIEILGKNKSGEMTGKIIRVVQRDKDVWVGVVKEVFNRETKRKEKTFIADNFRFYPETEIVNLGKFGKLKDNKKVLIKLIEWKNSNHPAKIEIKQILGKIGENETEMKAAVLDKGLIIGFPPEVEEAAKKLKERSKELIENDRPNRKDLTHLGVFTIDPADAKDFDDALHVRKLENGNVEVGVHIADPSFFVEVGGILDKEAQKRATSIYLVDRTIPMLPEVLSNDLCSLNANEEKMAFSLIFELDENAKIVSKWFGKSIIISKRRFDYMQAQKVIDDNSGDFLEELKILMHFTDILEKRRVKEGSIEFSSTETKFRMDEDMFPYEVYIKPRVRTMEMIEEFMLLANKEISKFASLDENGEITQNPFIYRIHAKPKQEKIIEVLAFLEKMNIFPDVDEDGTLSAREINSILAKFKNHPEEGILSLSILRSMQKAEYSTNPTGHFGLAFDYYSHFTSPIRRYPDMIAHRLALKYLNNESVPAKEKMKVQSLAEHSSVMEQKAVMAERESISFKYSQYYSKRIGEKFYGIITGVAKFGFFVEDEKTKAQAMVNVRNIGDDFFEYIEKEQMIVGQKTKKTFKLGMRVKAKVLDVNIDKRKIDLELEK